MELTWQAKIKYQPWDIPSTERVVTLRLGNDYIFVLLLCISITTFISLILSYLIYVYYFRYNYLVDVNNRAMDYFYQNVPNPVADVRHSLPSSASSSPSLFLALYFLYILLLIYSFFLQVKKLPAGSSTDVFASDTLAVGAIPIMQVTTIGWVAQSTRTKK